MLNSRQRDRLSQTIRLSFVLVLILLDYTNLWPFLTAYGQDFNAKMPRQVIGVSPYAIDAVVYLVTIMVVLLQPRLIKSMLEKPLFYWVFACAMIFTFGMLVRSINPPPGIDSYDFTRLFVLRINSLVFLASCIALLDDSKILERVQL